MRPLDEAFEHHLWATQRLIDHLRRLPVEALSASGEGVYGQAIATLSHMVGADGRYLTYLEGEVPGAKHDEARPLDDLAAELANHARRWRALLAKATEAGDLDVTIPAKGERPEMAHAANLLFAQALHHGTDHRTQICTVLSANGFESPNLDVWQYWLERRLGRVAAERR